jgi:hypothetical protein
MHVTCIKILKKRSVIFSPQQTAGHSSYPYKRHNKFIFVYMFNGRFNCPGMLRCVGIGKLFDRGHSVTLQMASIFQRHLCQHLKPRRLVVIFRCIL